MGKILLVAGGLLVVCCFGVAWGTMWYVAPPPSGSDSNEGTEEVPFATIQKGIDTAGDGDTVIVAPGPISRKSPSTARTSSSVGNRATSWIDDGSKTGVPPSLVPRRFYRIFGNP